MKKILSCMLLAALTLPGFAQLSTRTNDAINEPMGARPQAGDMALSFGLNLSSLLGDSAAGGIENENSLSTGNPLTFRYYKTDDMVIRGGIRLYKESSGYNGTTDSTTNNFGGNQPTDPTLKSVEHKKSMREYVLVPGVEKHFNAANIFDVYAGGDLYLGFRKDMTKDNKEFLNGDFSNSTSKTGSTVIGLGGVIGFNVFIAQLPIALGMEYGWTAKWSRGGKTETEVNSKSGSTEVSQVYLTHDDDNNQYSDLSRGEFSMDTNQNVRLTLNIYFNRK